MDERYEQNAEAGNATSRRSNKYFSGAIQEAIAICRGEGAFLIVFLKGADEESQRADEKIYASLTSEHFHCVALRLHDDLQNTDSEAYKGAKAFREIFPSIQQLPFLMILGPDGKELTSLQGIKIATHAAETMQKAAIAYPQPAIGRHTLVDNASGSTQDQQSAPSRSSGDLRDIISAPETVSVVSPTSSTSTTEAGPLIASSDQQPSTPQTPPVVETPSSSGRLGFGSQQQFPRQHFTANASPWSSTTGKQSDVTELGSALRVASEQAAQVAAFHQRNSAWTDSVKTRRWDQSRGQTHASLPALQSSPDRSAFTQRPEWSKYFSPIEPLAGSEQAPVEETVQHSISRESFPSHQAGQQPQSSVAGFGEANTSKAPSAEQSELTPSVATQHQAADFAATPPKDASWVASPGLSERAEESEQVSPRNLPASDVQHKSEENPAAVQSVQPVAEAASDEGPHSPTLHGPERAELNTGPELHLPWSETGKGQSSPTYDAAGTPSRTRPTSPFSSPTSQAPDQSQAIQGLKAAIQHNLETLQDSNIGTKEPLHGDSDSPGGLNRKLASFGSLAEALPELEPERPALGKEDLAEQQDAVGRPSETLSRPWYPNEGQVVSGERHGHHEQPSERQFTFGNGSLADAKESVPEIDRHGSHPSASTTHTEDRDHVPRRGAHQSTGHGNDAPYNLGRSAEWSHNPIYQQEQGFSSQEGAHNGDPSLAEKARDQASEEAFAEALDFHDNFGPKQGSGALQAQQKNGEAAAAAAIRAQQDNPLQHNGTLGSAESASFSGASPSHLPVQSQPLSTAPPHADTLQHMDDLRQKSILEAGGRGSADYYTPRSSVEGLSHVSHNDNATSFSSTDDEADLEADISAHIAFRLTNGTSLKHEFPGDSKLGDVFAYIDNNRTDGQRPYQLRTPFPYRLLSASQHDMTLLDLDLCPRSVLFLQPESTSLAIGASGIAEVVVEYARTYIMALAALFLGFFSGMFGGPEKEQIPAVTDTPAELQSQGLPSPANTPKTADATPYMGGPVNAGRNTDRIHRRPSSSSETDPLDYNNGNSIEFKGNL